MKNNKYQNLFKEARNKHLKNIKGASKDIINIYKDIAKELEERAVKSKPGSLNERWLLDYRKEIKKIIRVLTKELNKKITQSMKKSTTYPIEIQLSLFELIDDKYSLGVTKSFSNVFSRVPHEVLNILTSGGFYKDNKSLSKRIWLVGLDTQKGIDYIIKQGIAAKKSVYDIAKDLEKFVNPEARKDFEWIKVYPNLTTKKVDYNAQRLARTSINHAFFLSNIKSSERNPFVEVIHWELSSSHFTRQVIPYGEDVCDEYATQNDYGLGVGNFPIEEVPVPHPQCLCSQWPVITKSLEEIGNELRNWLDGESNPKLDLWYKIYGKEFTI